MRAICRWPIRLALVASLFTATLAGCAVAGAPASKSSPVPLSSPTALAQAQPTATATATSTATPTSSPSLTPLPSPVPPPVDALVQTVKSALPAKAFADVKAFGLLTPDSTRQLWAVHSTGLRGYESMPPASHFVAVYSWQNRAWQQVARLELDSKEASADFLETVKQVDLGAPKVMLEVTGGAGAHSGTYQIVTFDGQQLRLELSAGNSFAGFGQVRDLDGDGRADVVLDHADAYVFCYACGVRKPLYRAHIWNTEQGRLAEVGMAPLVETTPAQTYQRAANRAVELARAGLWQSAIAKAAEAKQLATGASAAERAQLAWNQALIKLHADAALAQVREGAYPLLANVFYGDYAAAVDGMRQYVPAQVFGAKSPLIEGTVAMNWVKELAAQVTTATNAALQAEPDLAAAYFLRGWAAYLNKPSDPAVKADVARAAQLAPSDAFYKAAAQYLQ